MTTLLKTSAGLISSVAYKTIVMNFCRNFCLAKPGTSRSPACHNFCTSSSAKLVPLKLTEIEYESFAEETLDSLDEHLESFPDRFDCDADFDVQYSQV